MNEKADRPAPGDEGQDTSIAIAVLLAAAAVLAATLGFRSALLGDSGSDTWHEAVREDVKRGAGLVEDVRFVYEEEAPAALQVAADTIQAEENERAADGKSGEVAALLRTEAGKHAGLVEVNFEASAIASDPKYDQGKDGYDVIGRLADNRAENPDLVALDPDETEQEGSDDNDQSVLLLAATIPAGLAFLCGAFAQGFPTRQRPFVVVGFVFLAVGLVAAIVIEVTA